MYVSEELFPDFLSQREISWVGIDFSMAKFTRKGFAVSQEILQRYFNEWNMLIITDQKKYDVRMSFRKPVMQYDLSWVSKKNKTVKLSRALGDFITLEDVYNDEAIVSYVEDAALPAVTDYALMMVVESFDDSTKLGQVWVVVKNMPQNKVVLCEKFMKEPGGFGLRNYWARVFYNVLFEVQKSAYHRWENLFK